MKVFDGHNDVLLRLWQRQEDVVDSFEGHAGHINAEACRTGGFKGGFFAIYAPKSRTPAPMPLMQDGVLEEPLPDPLDPGWALHATMSLAGIALALEAAGHLSIVRSRQDLKAAWDSDRIACILHLEGADGLDIDLHALDVLYAAGLRSLGPVWSRPNAFGHGVPFAHARDGNTGPGLTDNGKRLAARCAELGILLDCSHITMKGFYDIADLGLPVVATHSNVWDLCKSSRNLTQDQLSVIRQSGGIAGFNFEPAFISETGFVTGQASLDDCMRQLDAMLDALGENAVAIGSDFDGARTPQGISSAADLPVLIAAMRAHGYDDALIAKICHGNWLAFLDRHFEHCSK